MCVAPGVGHLVGRAPHVRARCNSESIVGYRARGGTAVAHAQLSAREIKRAARKGTVRSRGALRAVAVRPGSARARHPADRHRGNRCPDRRARLRTLGGAGSDARRVGAGDRRPRNRRVGRVRELGAGVRRAREPVDRPRATGRPRDPGGLAAFAAGARRGVRNRPPHGAPRGAGSRSHRRRRVAPDARARRAEAR